MQKLIIILILLSICHFGKAQSKWSDSLVKINPKLPTVLEFRNNEAQMNLINSVPVRNYCGCGSKAGLPPLYILDGKEISDFKMDIRPDNIESIKVLSNKKDAEKYGEKGKNGIIIITSKKAIL
jgi:hypothetical protein